MSDLCRRTVLKGAAATCGASLLAACAGGDAPAVQQPGSSDAGAGAPPGGGGGSRVSLAALSEVPVGGAVSASAPDGTNLIITQPSAGEVVAFSAVCPHEGCTVAPDGGQLTCPCHGSQFELSGEVKQGPADRALTPFPVRVQAGQVLPA